MKTMKDGLLSQSDLKRCLAELPAWAPASDGRSIRRQLAMEGFSAAADLISRIAREADAMDHHPDIHLTGYRNLVIELSTHSAGGITDKDILLARKIEALPKKLKA